MSKDIRDFEPKVIGPFSMRQIICIAIGTVIAIPVAIILPLPLEIRLIIAVFCAGPAIICAFMKMYGMNPEIFFINVFLPYYINPKSRKYITTHSTNTINTSEYIMGMVEAEKKKQQNEAKPKKIKYSKNMIPRK